MAIKPKAKKIELLSWEDRIVPAVDWEKVGAAIDAIEPGTFPFEAYDQEDARRSVWLVGQKWAPRDLASFEILEIEVPFESVYARGVKDLVVRVRESFPEYEYAVGHIGEVDWKTTKTGLGHQWRQDLIDSWQWRTYAASPLPGYEPSKLFQYRGIGRNQETQEVHLEIPEGVEEAVDLHYTQLNRQRNSLVTFGEVPWPRNMPNYCNAYGRTCEYHDDCRNDTYPLEIPPPKKFSFSGMKTFQGCPERHRRDSLNEGPAEGTSSTTFGSAVHRGLAELYTQLKTKFQ
jgi:hypothetical protein